MASVAVAVEVTDSRIADWRIAVNRLNRPKAEVQCLARSGHREQA
jgi:hypothetical protein